MVREDARLYHSTMRAKNFTLAASVFLATIALVCMAKGLLNALSSSKDFQWSPAALFVQGVDPYAAFLAHDARIILTQAPNYLPPLYIFFAPLALMPFGLAKIIWAVINLTLAVAAPILLSRKLGHRALPAALLTAAFLAATPTRTVIGNGQLTLVVLFSAIVAYLTYQALPAGAALAVAVTKHSFAPTMVIGLLARSRYRVVAWAVGSSAVLTLVFSAIVGRSPWHLAQELSQVNKSSVGLGLADVMSVAQLATGTDSGGATAIVVGLIATLVLSGISWRMLRYDWLSSLTATSVISLMTFKHLSYDFVFLLPMAVYGLYRMHGLRRFVVLAVCGYIWYFYQFIDLAVGRLLPKGQIFVLSASAILLFVALIAMATGPHLTRKHDGLKAQSTHP